MKKDIGLILSGGGAKGAYQIGVFRALEESNLKKYITGISGTSIGALNTALFTCSNAVTAEEIWKNVKQSDLLFFNPDEFIKNLINDNLDLPLLLYLKRFLPLYNKVKIIKFLLLYKRIILNYGGLFSQDKLKQMLNNDIDIDVALVNKYNIFSTTCNNVTDFVSKAATHHSWNNKTKSEIIDIILGSSAIPFIYPKKCKLDFGIINSMCDGGIADNTPIRPLYNIGYRNFIVVYLLNNKNKALNKLIEDEKKDYPDAKIIRIIPNHTNFGDDLYHTFKTDKGKTIRLIETGYQDTMFELKGAVQFGLNYI